MAERTRLTGAGQMQVKVMMAAAGLTQEQAARAVGVSQSHLSQQLSGRFSMSRDQLTRLRQAIVAELAREEEVDGRTAVAV